MLSIDPTNDLATTDIGNEAVNKPAQNDDRSKIITASSLPTPALVLLPATRNCR